MPLKLLRKEIDVLRFCDCFARGFPGLILRKFAKCLFQLFLLAFSVSRLLLCRTELAVGLCIKLVLLLGVIRDRVLGLLIQQRVWRWHCLVSFALNKQSFSYIIND